MAERLAGKKAEQYAQERGAAQVEEHHIVAALIAETPAPFQSSMRDTARTAGFDMPVVAHSDPFGFAQGRLREESDLRKGAVSGRWDIEPLQFKGADLGASE